MSDILVIANPAASRGGATKALVRLRGMTKKYEALHSFDFMVTENPKHATKLTKMHSDDYDIVAAFGGDGTINEVAQGLVGSNTPMGVLPYGTGNDFARSAGIPLDLSTALDLLCNGLAVPTDLGRVNDEYFVNAVGIGFDGRANYEASKINWLKGDLVFLVAIFKTIRYWQATPMTIAVDGSTSTKTSYLVGIGNGWSVGGGLMLTPDAQVDDGLLHVCHVSDIGPLKIMLNFGKLKQGTLGTLDEVALSSGKTVIVDSELPLPVHVDGEVLGLDITHLELQSYPGALNVIRSWA
ncbi:diacylglycerol/lipid kinase family protein [Candidatus Neomarinimicrobiota bacterium]